MASISPYGLSTYLATFCVGLATALCTQSATAQHDHLRLTNVPSSVLGGVLSPRAALQNGFYAAERIDVTFVIATSGPDAIQKMVAGDVNGGVDIGTLPFFQGVAAGVDLVWLASTLQNSAPVMTRKPIKSIKDLDGMRMGSPGIGTIQDTLFLIFEREHGVKTRHVYGRMTDLIGYLERGELDGVVGWQPTMEIARRKLGASYVTKAVLKGAQITGIVLPRSYVTKNRDVVKRFVRANLRGIQAYQKDKNAFFEWVAKTEKADVELVKNLYLDPDQFWTENPYIDRPSTKVLIKAARDAGKIPATMVPNDAAIEALIAKVVDEGILNEVAKEINFSAAVKR